MKFQQEKQLVLRHQIILIKIINNYVKKYLNISQVSEILNLVHPITKKPLNYIIRYWEKEFRIIKPKKN